MLPEYAIAGEGESESAVEKLNRLRHEVKTFIDELEAASKASTVVKDDTTIAPGVLAEQVRSVQRQLEKVVLDTAAPQGMAAIQSHVTAELVSKFNQYKAQPAPSASSSTPAASVSHLRHSN